MKATIDDLVQSISRDLAQYDSTSLAQQIREAVGAGPLVSAAQAREAIRHYAEDSMLPEDIRTYASDRLGALPTF